MIKVLSENDCSFKKEVKFIGLNGEKFGNVSFKEALDKSKENKVQLALMSDGDIPVVKLVDVGKILFEQKKNKKKNKQSIQKIKEIKFGLNVGEHDFNIKVNHIKDFIESNYKVKVTLQLFGREIQRENYAMEFFEKIQQKINEFAKTDEKPKLNGKLISVYYVKK